MATRGDLHHANVLVEDATPARPWVPGDHLAFRQRMMARVFAEDWASRSEPVQQEARRLWAWPRPSDGMSIDQIRSARQLLDALEMPPMPVVAPPSPGMTCQQAGCCAWVMPHRATCADHARRCSLGCGRIAQQYHAYCRDCDQTVIVA